VSKSRVIANPDGKRAMRYSMLELLEALGYALELAWAMRAVGLMHYECGERPRARRFLEESLWEARRADVQRWWLLIRWPASPSWIIRA
jgi:hypothetical protein